MSVAGPSALCVYEVHGLCECAWLSWHLYATTPFGETQVDEY